MLILLCNRKKLNAITEDTPLQGGRGAKDGLGQHWSWRSKENHWSRYFSL